MARRSGLVVISAGLMSCRPVAGHLVPANHADNSPDAIRQSNYMTNVLPQASNMNRGAWLRTEEIAECYRDIEPVTVIGGVIWGDRPRTDFIASHGVVTPGAFWKVLFRRDRAIAWVIPVGCDRE